MTKNKTMKYLLGVDIGSSSVKCALVDIDSGECVASAFSPSSEMKIVSPEKGFAEQDPNLWWDELCNAMSLLSNEFSYAKNEIAAIGISGPLSRLDQNRMIELAPAVMAEAYDISKSMGYAQK